MWGMRRAGPLACCLWISLCLPLVAQVPAPFPKPAPPPAQPPAPPPPNPAQQPLAAPSVELEPTEANLGFPIYPNARFIASFDAGRGQRYYLFGARAEFTVLVDYYRTVLKTRGVLVFDTPPTHIFEVGRFREES